MTRNTDPIPLGLAGRTDLVGRLLWQAEWDDYNAGPLCAEAAARIATLEAELRLVAGWFMKGDDGGLLMDHGGGWVSGAEFPNLSTYIDEVQP